MQFEECRGRACVVGWSGVTREGKIMPGISGRQGEKGQRKVELKKGMGPLIRRGRNGRDLVS